MIVAVFTQGRNSVKPSEKVFCKDCKYLGYPMYPLEHHCRCPEVKAVILYGWYTYEESRHPRYINKNNDCPFFEEE